MARNLLIVAKFRPGVSAELDAAIHRTQTARDLAALATSLGFGAGLIYWSCWYDGWSMGDTLEPTHWDLGIIAQTIGQDIWELSLDSSGWEALESRTKREHQWQEQDWLVWHLFQAWSAFQDANSHCRLILGREVLGPSLSDEEVSGQPRPAGGR